MKTLEQAGLVATLAVMLSLTAYAAGQTPAAKPAFPPMVLPVAGPAVTSAPMARTAPTAESQWVSNHLANLFAKAREAFVKTDLKAAAVEIRKSAAVLRKQESNATPEIKKELAATALDLERLALRVEQDKIRAGGEFDAVFYRADNAVAPHNSAMTGPPATASAPTAPAHLQTTAPRPEIPTTAARQAMPSRQSVNAAYAPPDKHTEGNAASYEELNKRIDALAKELSVLQADLRKLKSHEAGSKS